LPLVKIGYVRTHAFCQVALGDWKSQPPRARSVPLKNAESMTCADRCSASGGRLGFGWLRFQPPGKPHPSVRL
jgi:hypothetical protein